MLGPISQEKSGVFPGWGSEQSEQGEFGWVGSGEHPLARRGGRGRWGEQSCGQGAGWRSQGERGGRQR